MDRSRTSPRDFPSILIVSHISIDNLSNEKKNLAIIMSIKVTLPASEFLRLIHRKNFEFYGQ